MFGIYHGTIHLSIDIYICIDVMCHDIPIIAQKMLHCSQAAPHLSRSRSPKLKAMVVMDWTWFSGDFRGVEWAFSES